MRLTLKREQVGVREGVPRQIARAVDRVLFAFFAHLCEGEQAVELRLQMLGLRHGEVGAARRELDLGPARFKLDGVDRIAKHRGRLAAGEDRARPDVCRIA